MQFQNLGSFGKEKEKSIMKPLTRYKYVDPTSSGRDSHEYKIKEDYLNDWSLFVSIHEICTKIDLKELSSCIGLYQGVCLFVFWAENRTMWIFIAV